MSTGFERMASDRLLQDHWIRRVIAVIIDFVLMTIAGWVITAFLIIPLIIVGMPFWIYNFALLPFITGILSIFYFSVMELVYGYTVGKMVMNLKVVSVDGKPLSVDKLLIRNISKIFWLFLLLDVVIGLATPGDPHQKYMDRLAGVTVASTGASLLPS
ncbi:MAG: RDD family protein, partial [Candidatus Bathyarchaeia archaeon]